MLSKLSIRGCIDISDEAFQQAAVHTTLREIDLSKTKIDIEGFLHLLNCFPHLESISLEHVEELPEICKKATDSRPHLKVRLKGINE